ncbi:MAG TPA: insulinase family protein [Kofleriaceae bacterium]|nr:insulinase family protein [Kofleriaceae bacterium]
MSKRLLTLALAALVACGGSPKTTPTTTGTTTATTPTSTPASSTDPDAAPLPLWSKLKKGTLPNGLTYYILPHKKPEKRALLWLAVNAGSAQEDDDQRGLAHFDEHMAFNGTKRFKENELVKYLESIGMRFGADLNARTSWDDTVYQLEVPSDKPEFMGKGLDILRDWAGDVTYDPKEVDKERGVVLEEWRLGRGAGMRLFDKHAKVMFKGSRYANRITIGDPDTLKKAPVDKLVRYYKDWYRPNNMAVIAVGDFDPEAMEKEIVQRFQNLENPKNERKRPSGGVPEAKGTRVSIETDREATSTTVSIENPVAHRPETSKKDYRRILSEQIYTGILNERLASIARRGDAPFITAGGQIAGAIGVRDVDSFSRFAVAKKGNIEDALRALLTEVVRIEKHGITSSELERARTNMTRFYESLADTEATRDSSDFTEEITRNFFEGELIVGSQTEKKLALDILPTLTIAELNKIGTSLGGEDGRVILISGPEGKPLPTQERVLQIAKEVSSAKVDAWEDAAPQTALMDKAPTAGTITKETKNDKVGVTEWTLSNGVRVIVKPTDFEADSVSISGSSPGGDAMAKDTDFPSTRFADDVADLGGVATFDVETLGKMLAGKQVSVSTGIGETTESVSANGSPKDLETMMQLLYLRMTAPRKDVEAFNVWKTNFKEQIENALRSPEFRYARESNTAEWKGNLRRKPPEPAEIGKIDQDKALAFYKQRFGDASDFTFVIVGSVKLETLKPLVETYLASLPAKGRKEKEKDLKIRRVGGIVKKSFKLGTEPKASVSIEFHGPDKWTRDNDRDIAILGQVLSVKLREMLREDMGGVYGVGAGGRISRSPYQERTFSIRFGCDPTRVDELVKASFDAAAKLAKDGADDATLASIKETFVRARETDLRTNRFWLGWLASAYKYGDDPALVLDTAPFVARIKSDLVKASAKRYLDAKQYYEAVMLPENADAAAKPAEAKADKPAKPGEKPAKPAEKK